MSDIHLLDNNPIDSRLTFTYKRRLHMAKRQNDGLRLTQYVPASKRWVPIPVISPAGQALHDHLIEHSIQV